MMTSLFQTVILIGGLLGSSFNEAATSDCTKRSFGLDRNVCVCTVDYCDFYETILAPNDGSYHVISTSKNVPGFTSLLNVKQDPTQQEGYTSLAVDYQTEFQTILGFGGGFTDSTGHNILSLSPPLQDLLMRSYFSAEGISYSLGRVPIAGSDFSPRPYSYDDVENDFTLQHFNLTQEDHQLKIPIIKRAQALCTEDLLLLGSPWSPPAWMKDTNTFEGSGKLLKANWDLYPKYLVKFLEAYFEQGLPIWGITTQNEPSGGLSAKDVNGKIRPHMNSVPWNQCAWTAEDMRDWIKCCLGPILLNSPFPHTKLISHDSTRSTFDYYNDVLFADPEAVAYVDGVANHWYFEHQTSVDKLIHFQEQHPSQILMSTEACTGFDSPPSERVVIGSWERAEQYASSVLQNLNSYVQAWIDWNLVLDTKGGPGWANNRVDAPILVNADGDEFYKQPMFYAMGHFSRFVPRGSVRLQSTSMYPYLEIAAFKDNSRDTISIIILNKGNQSEKVTVPTHTKDFINVILQPKSLTTLITRRTSQPKREL